jgi:hypothetical protein
VEGFAGELHEGENFGLDGGLVDATARAGFDFVR